MDEPEAEEEDPVNRQWKQVRSIFNEGSENCLGMQKTRKRKEWITPDTWKDIEERRQLKKKINDSRWISQATRKAQGGVLRDQQACEEED